MEFSKIFKRTDTTTRALTYVRFYHLYRFNIYGDIRFGILFLFVQTKEFFASNRFFFLIVGSFEYFYRVSDIYVIDGSQIENSFVYL